MEIDQPFKIHDQPSHPPMMEACSPGEISRGKAWFFCALLYGLACTLIGLGGGELWGNGGLRARVAAEMAGLTPAHAPGGQQSWWVPRLDGVPLLTKPPLQYWVVAGIGQITGRVGPLEASLPSVLAGLVVLFLAGWQGYRRFGWFGGATHLFLVPTCIAYFTQVPSPELDFPLAAWVFSGLVCLDWTFKQGKGTGFLPWLLFGVCLVGGFLQKWTGPVFLLPAAALLLVCRRGLRGLFCPGFLLAIFLAAGVSLGWLTQVAREVGWDFLREIVVEREGMQHLSPAHHGRPYPFHEWLTFPFLALGMGLPGCLAQASFRRGAFPGYSWFKGDPWPVILLVSVILPLVFWTLVPGHKPRHALPIIPPLLCLSAWILSIRWNGALGARGRKVCLQVLGLVAGVWLVLLVGKGYLKARESQSALAPTRVAAGLMEHLGSANADLQVRRMRDDGLQLALADLGVKVTRFPHQGPVPKSGWFLATQEERGKHFAGMKPEWETTDQQGASLTLFWLGKHRD